MKAILLAAGFGTRLKPLTDTLPKCLMKIKGKPLLEIWLDNLTNAGISKFIINTHYLNKQVELFVKNSQYKNKITLVYEPILLGTAGTLMANLDFFNGEDGLLIHADNYCPGDFKAFFEAHKQRPADCVMTMMTFQTDHPSSCGIVELNKDGIVIGFHEKVASPPGNLANGAIYLFANDFLQQYKKQYPNISDISTEILPVLTGKIFTYETKATFIDIGTPESLAKANES